MTRAFISYSHVDEQYRAELEKHLSLLKRQGLVDVWSDHRIPPGGEIDSHISAELEAAELILLLVSSDFIASDYCYGTEMKRALERHREGSAKVVAIIVRPCDWKNSPLGALKALPNDARPITKWPTLDDAFLDVVTALRKLVATPTAKRSSAETTPATTPAANARVAAARPRASSLALRKEFRDIDRDAFLDEGFAYVRAYFENSLEELGARNPGCDGKFRSHSEQAFTGAIYRNGEKVAGCYIRITNAFGRSRQIGYSGNDDANDNSFNETLSVDADDQSMFFKGMLNWSGGREKLTHEGVAEKLWDLFTERLR
ncbi:TIR domain-containing protein [Paraburkholderia sp. 32]|uniref:TIR domain-containing protein n=1 Tax=Paraburkholderia sp. 32 TaxID=2991057 RepID=UPI003D199472